MKEIARRTNASSLVRMVSMIMIAEEQRIDYTRHTDTAARNSQQKWPAGPPVGRAHGRNDGGSPDQEPGVQMWQFFLENTATDTEHPAAATHDGTDDDDNEHPRRRAPIQRRRRRALTTRGPLEIRDEVDDSFADCLPSSPLAISLSPSRILHPRPPLLLVDYGTRGSGIDKDHRRR